MEAGVVHIYTYMYIQRAEILVWVSKRQVKEVDNTRNLESYSTCIENRCDLKKKVTDAKSERLQELYKLQ